MNIDNSGQEEADCVFGRESECHPRVNIYYEGGSEVKQTKDDRKK